jgi:hypothetical protein
MPEDGEQGDEDPGAGSTPRPPGSELTATLWVVASLLVIVDLIGLFAHILTR